MYTDVNTAANSKTYNLAGNNANRVATLSDITEPGSGVLTIQKNGTSVGTFNANATANKSINITVPTTTSQLTNNSGFITNSALTGYATEQYVDSSISAISIPTKTSDLTNDSGFITSAALPTKTSDLTNDSGFITSSAIGNMVTTDTQQTITASKIFKDIIYASRSDNTRSYRIYNETTDGLGIGVYSADGNTRTYYKFPNYTTASTKVVATLDDIPTVPTNVSAFTNDAGYITGITSSDVTTALGYTPGTSNFSGDYDDLTDKPDLSIYAQSANLATVATSGSYNDLTNKPNTPTQTVVYDCGDSIGVQTNVTWSTDVFANFDYIHIYFRSADGAFSTYVLPTDVRPANNMPVTFSATQVANSGASYSKNSTWWLQADGLGIGASTRYNQYAVTGNNTVTLEHTNYMYLLKVVGYKNAGYFSAVAWNDITGKPVIPTPTVLYNVPLGESQATALTMSDSFANYDYIDIQYRIFDNQDYVGCTRIYNPNGKMISLDWKFNTDWETANVYGKCARYTLNGSTMTVNADTGYEYSNNTMGSVTRLTYQYQILITKVIGWKDSRLS